jgi:hypothetical protein
MMAVKSTHNKLACRKFGFPKLMISDDGCNNPYYSIVLFKAEGHGVVIGITKATTLYHVGEYKLNWSMDCFRDYNGVINLENRYE